LLLAAVVAGAGALFMLVDLAVDAGPTAIDSMRAGACPHNAVQRGCVVALHGTVVAIGIYPRRWRSDAHEVTLHDDLGRHMDVVAATPAFAQLAVGMAVEERRIDGNLLSLTLPDGSVLPVELSPVDLVWFLVLMIPFMSVGSVLLGLEAMKTHRIVGWFRPTSRRFSIQWPRNEPAKTLTGLAVLAYSGALLAGLLMYAVVSAAVGAGALVGALVGSLTFALLRFRQRRNVRPQSPGHGRSVRKP
jgi:hypothetical protein